MAGNTIRVPRNEFRIAMRELRSACHKKQAAVLTSRDGQLTIRVGMAQAVLAAEGKWLGRIALPSSYLLRLSRRLPDQDPLEISIGATTMRIDSFEFILAPKLPAAAPPEWIDASLIALVSFGRNQPSDVAATNPRFATRVELAQQRYVALVQQAWEVLRPLGVSEQEVEAIAAKAVVRWEKKLR